MSVKPEPEELESGEKPSAALGRADPDSRARTHLASERTFLAWLRTGAALVGLGLAAAQFLTHNLISGVPLTRTLAVILVLTGIYMVISSARRYAVQMRRIDASDFRPATTSIAVATLLMVLVGLIAIVFILALRA